VRRLTLGRGGAARVRSFERKALAYAPLGARGGPLLPGRWEGDHVEVASTPSRAPAVKDSPEGGVGSPGLGSREAACLLDALTAGSPASDCESVPLSLGNSSCEEDGGALEQEAPLEPSADLPQASTQIFAVIPPRQSHGGQWEELSALCEDLDRPGFRDFAPETEPVLVEPVVAGSSVEPSEGALSGEFVTTVHTETSPESRNGSEEALAPKPETAPVPAAASGPVKGRSAEVMETRLRRSVAAAEQLQALVVASSREVASLQRAMGVLEAELKNKGGTLEALQGEQRASRQAAARGLEEARDENIALRQALMDAELDLERAGAEATRLAGRVEDLEGTRPVTSQDFPLQVGEPQLSLEAQGPTVPKAELDRVRADAQAREESLRREGETLRLQIGAENARVERLEAQVEAARKHSGGVSEAAERYREQCDERVSDLKEQVGGLRELSEGLERRAARAEAALALAEEARSELQHRSGREANAHVELETRLEHAVAEKCALEVRLREADAELQSQRAKALGLAAQAAHAEGEASGERESVKQALEVARLEQEGLQDAVRVAQEEKQGLLESLAAQKEQFVALKARQEEAEDNLDRERADAAKLRLELDALRAGELDLKEQHEAREAELGDVLAVQAELEAGRETLAQESAGLRREVERLERTNADLVHGKGALEEALKAAAETAVRKGEEHGSLAGQLQAELAEERRARDRREESARAEARREALGESREELAALRAQVEERTAVAGALRSEATVARSRLEAAEEETRKLAGQLSEKAAQVDKLERSREEKSKFSVQRLQGLLYAREKELRHLQRKCRGLEEQLEEVCGERCEIFELSPSSTVGSASGSPGLEMSASASGSASKGAKKGAASPLTPGSSSARCGGAPSPLRPVDLNSA